MIQDYMKGWPGLDRAEIELRLASLPQRKKLLETFTTKYQNTFGGSWIDMSTGIWHLAATSPVTALNMAADAASAGLTVETHEVQYSYNELAATADRVRFGNAGPLSQAAIGRVAVDVRRNKVTVVLTAGKPDADARAIAAADQRISLSTVDSDKPVGTPAACSTRLNCGVPLRGGVEVHGPKWSCSAGFTATATDGSRWLLTAGHCPDELNERWTHGDQYIGAVRQKQWAFTLGHPITNVDFARIRMENPYWLSASGGFMYHTPDSTVDVDNAIASMALIEEGDPVCYDGRWSDGGDTCGIITNVADPLWGGMPGVSSISVCHGDSGGSVYLLFNGERWGYGLVSGIQAPEDVPCATNVMWFSPLPAIYQYMDANSAATVRVDTR